MKQQPKQFLLLLVALVVLVGGYYGLRAYNKSSEEKAEQEAMQQMGETMIAAEVEEIVGCSYDYNGGIYTYEKENDTWYYAEDHSLNLQQSMITGMLEKFAPLVSRQKIDNVMDYAQYGLEEPSKTVTICTEKEEYTVYVGDYNSITAASYFRMGGDDAVYVTTAAINGSFNKTVEELIQEAE